MNIKLNNGKLNISKTSKITNFLDLTNMLFSDMILCNRINKYDLKLLNDIKDIDNIEIHQYYIVELNFDDEYVFNILSENDTPIYYCDNIGKYILGVTFFGISWKLVKVTI